MERSQISQAIISALMPKRYSAPVEVGRGRIQNLGRRVEEGRRHSCSLALNTLFNRPRTMSLQYFGFTKTRLQAQSTWLFLGSFEIVTVTERLRAATIMCSILVAIHARSHAEIL